MRVKGLSEMAGFFVKLDKYHSQHLSERDDKHSIRSILIFKNF